MIKLGGCRLSLQLQPFTVMTPVLVPEITGWPAMILQLTGCVAFAGSSMSCMLMCIFDNPLTVVPENAMRCNIAHNLSFSCEEYLTRYCTAWPDWDCHHSMVLVHLRMPCTNILHPAVVRVRAVVDWCTVLQHVIQISASDLHDAIRKISTYVEENGFSASSCRDVACGVIAKVVFIICCVTGFLEI